MVMLLKATDAVPDFRWRFKYSLVALFSTSAMTSQNQNNVDASGSSFTEIGRDQVNQVHIGRDQIIYNFSSTSTDSIASKWSNQSGHSRSPNTSELSGSQNRFHTRDRRRRWKRPNSESWTEDDLRDAYDALQDELPSSTRNTSTYSILKRGMLNNYPSPFNPNDVPHA